VILSSFELASAEIRKAAEQRAAQQAREAITPQHAACEGAVDGDDDERARERARRVQHLADPAGEVAAPDMDKAFRDAFPGPAGYPVPSVMSPGRGPDHPVLQPGQATPSPGYGPPSAFGVPRATLNAADFRRGPLTEGQSALGPSYPEAS
jgi:hypothetical protein